MQEILTQLLNQAIGELFGIQDVAFSVEHPKEFVHGDFATNAALLISKQIVYF